MSGGQQEAGDSRGTRAVSSRSGTTPTSSRRGALSWRMRSRSSSEPSSPGSATDAKWESANLQAAPALEPYSFTILTTSSCASSASTSIGCFAFPYACSVTYL